MSTGTPFLMAWTRSYSPTPTHVAAYTRTDLAVRLQVTAEVEATVHHLEAMAHPEAAMGEATVLQGVLMVREEVTEVVHRLKVGMEEVVMDHRAAWHAVHLQACTRMILTTRRISLHMPRVTTLLAKTHHHTVKLVKLLRWMNALAVLLDCRMDNMASLLWTWTAPIREVQSRGSWQQVLALKSILTSLVMCLLELAGNQCSLQTRPCDSPPTMHRHTILLVATSSCRQSKHHPPPHTT